MRKVPSLSSAAMISEIQKDGDAYGCVYKVCMAQLGSERTYNAAVYIEAPNGFTEPVFSGEVTFGPSKLEWQTFLGGDYFKHLYQRMGEIPSGDYTITLLWNDMLVNQSVLKVGE